MKPSTSTIKSVCIIDDDNIYVSLLKKIILNINLCNNLIIFNNGQQSIEYFEQSVDDISIKNIPDIILLDINMPIMDGWEFLERFNKIKNKFNKDIAIYMVSSSINPLDINKAKSFPIVMDYIAKPINKKQLESVFLKEYI